MVEAARYGHDAVVRLLLERDDIDANARKKRGSTALIQAAAYGHEAVVRLLLADQRVDANVKDNSGKTALMRAKKRAARLLREHNDMEIKARAQNTWVASKGSQLGMQGGHDSMVDEAGDYD